MQELIHALGIEWPVLIAQIVNFAILLFVLQRFVYKPVIRMLDERRENARLALEREQHSEERLHTADAEKEQILEAARKESVAILETARLDGEEMKRKYLESAKEEAVRARADAEKRLKDERARLLIEVKAELGTLVVDTIERSLGDVLDARAQGKMVEQALAAIREGTESRKRG